MITVGILGLWKYPGLAMLWLLVAGLGAGMAMVTSLALFGLRAHDHKQAAALSSMGQFIGYLGSATGPFMVGYLHEKTSSWDAPFLFLILVCLALTVIAPLAGRDRLIKQ